MHLLLIEISQFSRKVESCGEDVSMVKHLQILKMLHFQKEEKMYLKPLEDNLTNARLQKLVTAVKRLPRRSWIMKIYNSDPMT